MDQLFDTSVKFLDLRIKRQFKLDVEQIKKKLRIEPVAQIYLHFMILFTQVEKIINENSQMEYFFDELLVDPFKKQTFFAFRQKH